MLVSENLYIEGVDVESGVKRFGGKVDLYKKMLRSFAMGLEIDDTPMEVAFSEERKHEYEVKLHTIKGVAGNMGSTALYEALVEFEKTERAGDPDKDLYDSIWRNMRAAKENILNALSDSSSVAQRPEGDARELRGLLTDLFTALEDSKPTPCETAVKALLTKRWAGVNDSELETLNKMVLDYNYDEATELVNKKLAVM